ncbi:PQQ-binding-like beta-propeller repeat protein [Micromonospora sp. NPDC005215]|uniref:outer membrane protein assembly factor BamB family protein n=1 Tax=Micromonospora sp. NPDC005215 TaxID=3157024 RepID=UPI0033AF8CCE
MTGPVIDLGELRHGPDPEPLPLPRPPRANGRPLRGALVLLLVLATLGSAAVPPPRPAAVTLPAQLAAEILFTADLFVVLDPDPGQPTRRRMSAFRLPDGDLLWQTVVPMQGHNWGITSAGGVLLVTVYEVLPPELSVLSMAFDRETGAYRWQQPGRPDPLADGNVLLQSGADDEPVTLRAVDPCCGTVRWQLTNAAEYVSLRQRARGVDRVVLHRRSGLTEVYDAITGAELARADLRPPEGDTYGSVQVVNDLLLTSSGSPARITAYGLDRLDQRWDTTTTDRIDYIDDCGPVLCPQRHGGELWGVDPATGQMRWRSSRWAWLFPYDGRMVATAARPVDVPPQRLFVVDPMTGRELADLGRWELAPVGLDGPLVGVRPHPDGGLVVAELDVRAGKARVLDVLPDVARNCQAIVGLLLCQLVDGSYRLFRMPR